MARNLATKQNVQPADSDYPYGRIKDDDGSGTGTPVDEAVYGDFHQFFARLFALSGLTYNNLPDSDYAGFQYVDAADKRYKRFVGVNQISTTTVLTKDDRGLLVNVFTASADIDVTLPLITDLNDGDTFTIVNNGAFNVTVNRSASPDAIRVVGGSNSSFELPGELDFVTFVVKENTREWFISEVKVSANPITVGSGGTAPAFQNSWGSSNGTLRFRLFKNGHVIIEGQVSKVGNGSGIIFTLPAGFRPSQNRYFPILITQSGGYVPELLYIETNGDVSLNNPAAVTTDAYLTGINFFV